MRAQLLALAVAGGLAAGCSAPQPAAPPPQQPVAQAPSFDGRYVGRIQITRNHNNWCDTPATFELLVRDNGFNWTLTRPNLPQKELYNPTFNVSIGRDGAFDVAGGNGELTELKGRIAGTHMAGEVDGKYCGYLFSADRS